MKDNGSIKFNRSDILVCFLFAAVTFGIVCTSASLVRASEFQNPDCAAYRYMGMLIAKGGVPYRDAFDNKGPLMYFLNFLGYLINREFGVFFVEYAAVFAFYLVSYKLCRRFLNSKTSFLCVILASAPFSIFFMGNMTEEYALVFIEAGILIFTDYFFFDKKSPAGIIICGFCFGCVLMLRVNMSVLWPVFCICVIVDSIKNEKKFPIRLSLEFLAGMAAAVMPFIVWFVCTGAINDFWKDYIVANMIYTGNRTSFSNVISSSVRIALTSCAEIYLLLLVFLIIKKEKSAYNITFSIYMILNILMVCMTGVMFPHYGMTIIPSLVYPVCIAVKYFGEKMIPEKKKYLMYICLMLGAVMLYVYMAKNVRVFSEAMLNGNQGDPDREYVKEYVINNTAPDDRILVLGYRPVYYLDCDRLCSSIFYYNSHNDNYPDGREAFLDEINENLPKMILSWTGKDEEGLFRHFDRYEKVGLRGVWLLTE